MRFGFLFLALGLSACAQANMVSDTDACQRLAQADRQAVWRMSAPGVISTGDPIVPSKKPVGGAADAAGCVHPEDGKGSQTKDLHKIG